MNVVEQFRYVGDYILVAYLRRGFMCGRRLKEDSNLDKFNNIFLLYHLSIQQFITMKNFILILYF